MANQSFWERLTGKITDQAKDSDWQSNTRLILPNEQEQQALGYTLEQADIFAYEQAADYWDARTNEKKVKTKVNPAEPRVFAYSQIKIAGGNADIFVGWDTRVGRRVILKRVNNIFKPNSPNRELQEQQLLREAQLQAKIDHQNILTIYDMLADVEGNLYLVLPEIGKDQGIDLFEWMRLRKKQGKHIVELGKTMNGGPAVTPSEFVQLVNGIAKAVDTLAKTHPHHDITPANIIAKFGQSGEELTAVVIDLGSARGVTQDTDEQIFGSPLYMSPERLLNPDFPNSDTDAEQRSELYSVACTLYEFITVVKILPEANASELYLLKGYFDVRRHNNQALQRELVAWGLNSEQIEAMLVAFETALDPDPANRYASTTEFAQVIQAILQPVIDERKVETNATGNRLRNAVRAALLGQ